MTLRAKPGAPGHTAPYLATSRGYHLGWARRRNPLRFNGLQLGQLTTWPLFGKKVARFTCLQLASGRRLMNAASSGWRLEAAGALPVQWLAWPRGRRRRGTGIALEGGAGLFPGPISGVLLPADSYG